MLVSAYETSMEPWIDKRCGVTQDLAARGQALEPLERPPSDDSHQGATEFLGP
jgi:hypothetical protein